jgi:hypothetical protein
VLHGHHTGIFLVIKECMVSWAQELKSEGFRSNQGPAWMQSGRSTPCWLIWWIRPRVMNELIMKGGEGEPQAGHAWRDDKSDPAPRNGSNILANWLAIYPALA